MNAPVALEPDTAVAPKRQLSRNALVMAAIAIVIAVAGVLWLLAPRASESTDNAYLRADSSAIAPKVGGLVTAILVKDNQVVHAGDPLIRIDPQDYDAKVAAAQAAVADADAGVASARAAIGQLAADERLASAQVSAAGTGIASADAEVARAAADKARYDALLTQGFATRRDADRIRTTAVGAISAAERSRAELQVSRANERATAARGPALAAALQSAEATALKARAALDLARLDQGHTVVYAPIDGVVGNRQVQIGDYVQPGSRVFTVVPTKALYVVANFKETQTKNMRAGQRARIYVDALGGEALTGSVESFAPGSGSEFTLLPFEPGSGNFTKIVQRVGVRIKLDPGQPALVRLRPGLSVTAKVDLR